MDGFVDTQRFVNGTWVTERVDIHRILAGNRITQSEKESPVEIETPKRQPAYGILTQTIARSPLVLHILAANLRHKTKYDVMFIGENFVHIKELGADGHLHHVTTKADLPGKVRAARVFGERRTEPQNLEQMNVDWSKEEGKLSPQMLVLTLDNGEFMFLFAKGAGDCVYFIYRTFALPAPPSLRDRPGKYLTVDPWSRAIAIAAWSGKIILYSTKPISSLDSEYKSDPRSWSPIQAQHPVQVEGTILQMEFLSPPRDSEDSVLLLVLFSSKGKLKITCFEWVDTGIFESLRKPFESQSLEFPCKSSALFAEDVSEDLH
jgi:hypothetical protein